jgi:hypothetical protein
MTNTPRSGDPLFTTRWVHVFEEDTAEGEVYRPDTADIPLSRRPRRHLSLSPDGSATIGTPGPDDRPREVNATWRRQGDDVVVSLAGERGGGDRLLRVSLESPTRLVVRK